MSRLAEKLSFGLEHVPFDRELLPDEEIVRKEDERRYEVDCHGAPGGKEGVPGLVLREELVVRAQHDRV